MAITKTLIANGSKKKHKFTLNTTETETSGNSSFIDYSFILSAIQTGWDWADWGSKISYEIKFTETVVDSSTGETQTNELYKTTGTIPKYDGKSTIILSSGSEIEIEHDSDGTKTIDISFTVTDSTGASYTCGNASASGSMILSELHTPPEITGVSISETNTTLTNLGVTNDTVVQYLSKKKFTITAQTYDDAVISSYSIYHNNILIGTSTTNEITIDFNNVSELMTTENDGTHYVGLMIILTDDKGGYSSKMFNFPVIKYTRPTIESTSTTIKRKTSGGTVLTDNKVLLNFVGTCYKGDDVIGSANTPIVQYKIWKDTEPDYTKVSATNASNVTVTDFEISNILYTNVYNYKIKIYDSFTNSEENPIEKVSIVPTGVSVWSEYKDRVDFKKITQGNKAVVLEPTTLYESTEGTSENITLNDSSANYKYIEIFYYNANYQNIHSSVKVPNPNGKQIELRTVYPDMSNNRMYLLGTYYSCSEKTLNYVSGYGLAISGSSVYGVAQDTIKIVKVIGYK